LPLDGRRAVYLVRVKKIIYVIGASEAGLTKLGELSDEGLELEAVDKLGPPFADVLARVMGRRAAAPTEGGDGR